MSILFVSNSNFGTGLSGGDRIFLELLRRWQKRQPISLMGAAETKNLLQNYGLSSIPFYQTASINKNQNPSTFNVLFLQTKRTISACFYVLFHHKTLRQFTTLYSVSDFYADFIPSLLIKIFNPKIIWIAGYYLFAPNPSSPESPYRQNHQIIKGYVYHYAQKITLVLTNLFADFVFVTSAPDVSKFPHKKVVIIRGGVDTTPSNKYFQKYKLAPYQNRPYMAVFIGRLHPQKGAVELIDIWKLVVDKIPTAKLALIGNGQLESTIKSKINRLHLQKNIDLLGFMENQSKYNIFKNSAIVLHPARYDSGGMASAEAMSWGLPGISFNLDALKTYYPQGMIKIPCFNNQLFADTIIKIYQDQVLYQKTSKLALQLIKESWNWDNQAKSIYQQVFKTNGKN